MHAVVVIGVGLVLLAVCLLLGSLAALRTAALVAVGDADPGSAGPRKLD